MNAICQRCLYIISMSRSDSRLRPHILQKTLDPGLRALLSHPFARLSVYRACTTLSYQVLTVTAGWHMYAITHDVLNLGLLGLAEVIPYFCSSLFAGHAVDVLSKRALALAGCL